MSMQDIERAAFEAWIKSDSTLPVAQDAHGYSDMTTALMWHAWQAARAAAPEVAQQEPATHYSFRCFSCRQTWERRVPDSDCPRCGTTNHFCAEDLAAAPPAQKAPEVAQGEPVRVSGLPDGWRIKRRAKDIQLYRCGTAQPSTWEPGDIVHALLCDLAGTAPRQEQAAPRKPHPWEALAENVRDKSPAVADPETLAAALSNIGTMSPRLRKLYDDTAAYLRRAAPQDGSKAPVAPWRDPAIAPKDGRLLRLLVNFSEHAMEDDLDPQATVGTNSLDNTGIDEWQFAGWSWEQDCFTQGAGIVLGWLPMLEVACPIPAHEAASQGAQQDAARYRWLRDRAPGEIVFDHTERQSDGGSRFVLHVPFDGEPVHNDAHSALKLDEAIDVAMAAAPAQQAVEPQP